LKKSTEKKKENPSRPLKREGEEGGGRGKNLGVTSWEEGERGRKKPQTPTKTLEGGSLTGEKGGENMTAGNHAITPLKLYWGTPQTSFDARMNKKGETPRTIKKKDNFCSLRVWKKASISKDLGKETTSQGRFPKKRKGTVVKKKVLRTEDGHTKKKIHISKVEKAPYKTRKRL